MMQSWRDESLQFHSCAEHNMGMPYTNAPGCKLRDVRELVASSPLATPRYELVGGELLVTPSPAFLHQKTLDVLTAALRPYLAHTGTAHLILSPSDVELEEETMVQPDIFFVPEHEWRRLHSDGFPAREVVLVVEVLSRSSARYDRVLKRKLYQRHVPEYWIVDLDARAVERWRAGEDRAEQLSDLLEWRAPLATESFALDLTEFFARVYREQATQP
jgi:Uma2 family endonuclease